ncbi:MAG: dihydroorotase [Rhodospirillales bacterium]|jgi:dihydroorotase|nr:dihydroorotase [Rhodospirillales bacterium]
MSTKRADFTTPGKIAYINAHLINPASGLNEVGALFTNGRKIEDFGPELFRKASGWDVPDGIEVIDCKGLYLSPGFVDMRVQTGEPGFEYRGNLETAGKSATSGGITSMVCLPNTNPVIDDMSVVEFVARRARKLGLTKVYPYGAITKGTEGVELAEMGLLAESGAVAFTDGIKTITSAKVMSQAMSYASTFDLLLINHPEEPTLAGSGVMNQSETSTRLGLSGIPAMAEVIMVERDIRIAEMKGARLHLANISTGEACKVIANAKKRGVRVTCDTAPPYFALNETAVGDYRTFSKLSPPLRSEADRLAIIEALKDGTIDAIASDHNPQDAESKRVPFAQAAFGGVGLDTLFALTLELYHNEHLSMLEAISMITDKPANLLNLPAGKLEAGRAADLTLFDAERGWKIDSGKLVSKSQNTPFDGRPVQGSVCRTMVDGRTVFELS